MSQPCEVCGGKVHHSTRQREGAFRCTVCNSKYGSNLELARAEYAGNASEVARIKQQIADAVAEKKRQAEIAEGQAAASELANASAVPTRRALLVPWLRLHYKNITSDLADEAIAKIAADTTGNTQYVQSIPGWMWNRMR